jgi:S-adenosylmethionine:diacylglycerol 3-amino-3-carboxypropyl transferase
MRITIEYCRTRQTDGMLAVVDRVCCDAVSHAAAKSIAVKLAASRAMPQTPDLVRILDAAGTEFFREAIEAPPQPDLFAGLVPVGGDSGK